MKPALRLIIAGTLIAAMAGGIWAWREARHRRDLRRHEQWMAYLHGPLSDLLEGSSRGRELLALSRTKALKKEQRQALSTAILSIKLADAKAQALKSQWDEDAFFEPMLSGLQWHSMLAQTATDWRIVAERKDLLADALAAEKGLRRNLAIGLEKQRARIFAAGSISKDRGLEINALLYSLKE